MTVNDDNLIDEANLLADALCKTTISDHKEQQTLVDNMLDNLINSTQESNGSTKALKVIRQMKVAVHSTHTCSSPHRTYY